MRSQFILATAVWISLLASPVHATTLMNWELDDFVLESRAVVTATVTDVAVRPPDDGTVNHTHITLSVDEVLAGATLPSQVVLQEMGGRIGYRATIVHGVPVYRPGEQVLVFLEELEDGRMRTLGMYRGKYTLEVDPDTQLEVYIQRAPSGVTLAGTTPEPETRYERDNLEWRIRLIAGAR
jgi:hypothetical protein